MRTEPTLGEHLAPHLIANIKLTKRDLARTNTLAYFKPESVRKKNILITLTRGACIMKQGFIIKRKLADFVIS